MEGSAESRAPELGSRGSGENGLRRRCAEIGSAALSRIALVSFGAAFASLYLLLAVSARTRPAPNAERE